MSEPFVIDHKNPKKIRVFNSLENSSERYPIIFNNDGSVICVDEFSEHSYRKELRFSASKWERWELIKEPKFREFKGNEFDEAINLLCGKWIKSKLGLRCLVDGFNTDFKLINNIDLNKLFKDFQYSDSPFSNDWKVIGKECEE